jgi:hypothetical protein
VLAAGRIRLFAVRGTPVFIFARRVHDFGDVFAAEAASDRADHGTHRRSRGFWKPYELVCFRYVIDCLVV